MVATSRNSSAAPASPLSFSLVNRKCCFMERTTSPPFCVTVASVGTLEYSDELRLVASRSHRKVPISFVSCHVCSAGGLDMTCNRLRSLDRYECGFPHVLCGASGSCL